MAKKTSRIVVKAKRHRALALATLMLSATVMAATPAYAALLIALNQTTYYPDQYLSLTGTGATPSLPVSIQVLNPYGSIMAVGQTTADAAGAFSSTNLYKIPSTPTGTWTVRATSGGISTVATFTLATPGPTYKVTTTAPLVKDTSGNLVASPKVNILIVVTSTVTNTQTTSQQTLFIVQIKDSSGIVVSFGFATGTVPASTSIEYGVSWKPTSTGTYTIEVYAWDNFSSATPLAALQTTSVTVT